MDYNTELERMQSAIYRKKRIETMLSDLYAHRTELERNVAELKAAAVKEQTEVDRLADGKLASFVWSLIGRKVEKLDKEEKEAMAAALKHDTAAAELDEILSQIKTLEAERDSIGNCEKQYEKLLAEKKEYLKTQNSQTADKICELDAGISYIKNQQKEIAEAVAAGKKALGIAEDVASELESADGWGTWDLLGGGFISDIAKHSHLDDAQEKVGALQKCLSSFRTELADVRIGADLHVQIDGFLRFADFFWDGLFADWAVLDKIHSSQEEISNTISSIGRVLEKLDDLRTSAQAEMKKKENELETLVVNG